MLLITIINAINSHNDNKCINQDNNTNTNANATTDNHQTYDLCWWLTDPPEWVKSES